MATQGHKLLVAGATVSVMEPVLALAHTGPLGVIVGLALGAAAYIGLEDIEAVAGKELFPARPPCTTEVGRRGPSAMQRLLVGKSMRMQADHLLPDGDRVPSPSQDTEEEGELTWGEAAQEETLTPPRLPGQLFEFSEVLGTFQPSRDKIFLARTQEGRDLFCSAKDLCHVAIAGNTGGGKCLEENEPVFLADGRIVPVKSLVGKMAQVVGVTDLQMMQQVPVPASFTDNGIRTVIEIELDNGVIIKRTEEHPLWAAQLDDRQYVGSWYVPADGRRRRSPRTRAINAGWVKAGDVRVCGNRPNFDGQVLLCPTTLHQQGTISRPDADVILCAALLAEGCLTKYGHVGFTNADAPMVALVSQAATQYGCELVPVSDQSGEYQYRICKKRPITQPGYKFCPGCGSEKLLEEFYRHSTGSGGREGRCKRCQTPEKKAFFKDNPPGGRNAPNPIAQLVENWTMIGHATTKTIPSWVFQLPDEQIATFLRVFIDCDGWFDASEEQRSRHPAVNVSLANPVLVQQIGQLALRLGIVGTYRYKENGHAGAWTWSSPMVDVWQERVGSTVKAEKLAHAVQEKQRRDANAATDWDAWRQARPTTDQTFADCPEGYEWRKVVAIRRAVAPTVNIEVHTSNHAFAGQVVEHNSSIQRMLMLQLCRARMNVLWLNPHYTRFDLENGEDWTPFDPYLLHPPMECRKYEVIEHYLKHMALELIPTRLERRAESLPLGKPYFIFMDELPAIIRHIKDAPKYMQTILEEGRKVGVFLVVASQDFLVKTINPDGGGGSIRECYRTGYYVGGDATTGKIILDMPARLIPEALLGKGVAMFRGAPQKEAAQSLVPYVSNETLYHHLGPSTYQPIPEGMAGIERDEIQGEAANPEKKRTKILDALLQAAESAEVDADTLVKLFTGLLPQLREEKEPAPVQPRLSPELQRALDAYEPGISYRELGKLIGVGKDKAGELLSELTKRGYISEEEDDRVSPVLSMVSSSSSSSSETADRGMVSVEREGDETVGGVCRERKRVKW